MKMLKNILENQECYQYTEQNNMFYKEKETLTEQDYQELANGLIEVIKDYISDIEREGLTNESWFLDFEDELNELSIKDHGISKQS